MSSGPPVRKPKPRSRSASWNDDRPRSNSAPSTASKPAAGATVGQLAEVRLAQDEPVAEPRPAARRPGRSRPGRRRARGRGRRGWRPPGSARCAHRRRPSRRSGGCRAPVRASQGPRPASPAGALAPSLLHESVADPERTLEAHVVRRQIPRPAMALGERVGVVEAPAVVGPAGRRPDLRVVAGPEHERLGLEAGELAQALRDEDATLAVELGLERAREQLALQQPGVRDRSSAGSRHSRRAHPRPVIGKIARQLSSHRATTAPSGELRAETRRDGDAPLAVDRMTVLAGEHRSRSLLTSDGGGWTDQPGDGSPPAGPCPLGGWFPTFHHFAPLPGIIARSGGPSMGKSHSGRLGRGRAVLGQGRVAASSTRRRGSDSSRDASSRPGRPRRPRFAKEGRESRVLGGVLSGTHDEQRSRCALRSGGRAAGRRGGGRAGPGLAGRSEARSRRAVPAMAVRAGRISAWAVASGSGRRRGGGRRSRSAGSSRRSRSTGSRSSGRCCTGCRPSGPCRSSSSAGWGTGRAACSGRSAASWSAWASAAASLGVGDTTGAVVGGGDGDGGGLGEGDGVGDGDGEAIAEGDATADGLGAAELASTTAGSVAGSTLGSSVGSMRWRRREGDRGGARCGGDDGQVDPAALDDEAERDPGGQHQDQERRDRRPRHGGPTGWRPSGPRAPRCP